MEDLGGDDAGAGAEDGTHIQVENEDGTVTNENGNNVDGDHGDIQNYIEENTGTAPEPPLIDEDAHGAFGGDAFGVGKVGFQDGSFAFEKRYADEVGVAPHHIKKPKGGELGLDERGVTLKNPNVEHGMPRKFTWKKFWKGSASNTATLINHHR